MILSQDGSKGPFFFSILFLLVFAQILYWRVLFSNASNNNNYYKKIKKKKKPTKTKTSSRCNVKHIADLCFLHFDEQKTSISVPWYPQMTKLWTILLDQWTELQILKGRLVYNLHNRYTCACVFVSYVFVLDDVCVCLFSDSLD